jgi:hypothetical protein
MKALFSRLTHNHDGVMSASSSTTTARDNKEDKRGRAISTTTSYSDKYQNSASLYAQPQDLLYPSNAAKQSVSVQPRPALRSNPSQQSGTASVKATWASYLPSSAGVGDAPKSPSFADQALAQKGTKTLFGTLRGRKPSPAAKGLDVVASREAESKRE